MTLALLPANPFRQTLRWATDVRQAWDGTEQREAFETDPRSSFAGAFFLPDAAYATQRQMLSSGPSGTFELPLIPEAVASANAITSTTITIVATYAEWNVAGRRVLVVGPSGHGYKATISSVGGGGATLTMGSSPPGGESYPAGTTMIYPLEDVLLEDGQQLGRYSVTAGRWSYSGRQATVRALAGTGATLVTFGGMPVLDRRPLGAEATEQIRGGVVFVDAGGAVSSSTAFDHSQHVRGGASWVISTPAERQWWKAFLAGQRGQRGAFLYPTWRPDLTLYSQPAALATAIRVTEDYSADWYPSLAHRRLQLEYADGTVGYFAVGSVTSGAGYDELALIAPLPSSIPGGSVSKVSFLETARLASDEVVIEYGPGWLGRVSLAAVVTQHAGDLIHWPVTAAEMTAATGGYGTWASGWQLDEASGTLADTFGGGVTMTAGSTPLYGQPGALGGADLAIGTNSLNDRFEAASSATYPGAAGGDFAVFSCFKLTTVPPVAFSTLIGKIIAGQPTWQAVTVLNASGHMYALVYDGISSIAAIIAADHADGKHHDILMCIDRTNSLLTLTSDLGTASVSIAGYGAFTNTVTMHFGGTAVFGTTDHVNSFTAIATGDVPALRANATAAIAAIRRYTGRV